MSQTASAEWRNVLDEMTRVRGAVRRHGVSRTVRRLASAVGRLAYLHESVVWYRLDLPARGDRIPLPRGITVIRATEHDLHLLDDLPIIGRRLARTRLAQGADLWIAHESGHAAFCCWTFRDQSPSVELRRGWLELPPRTVALQDSLASPGHRGRSIASATWSKVVETLSTESLDTVVTKIDERDIRWRRAIERVGFRAVASMQLLRVGGCARVTLHLHEETEITGFLAAQLAQ
jgi:hypothetical protein